MVHKKDPFLVVGKNRSCSSFSVPVAHVRIKGDLHDYYLFEQLGGGGGVFQIKCNVNLAQLITIFCLALYIVFLLLSV